MTADELREVEAAHQAAFGLSEIKREERNAAVRQALEEGWSQAKIAEATGLTRGRINQITKDQRSPRRSRS